MLFDRLKKKRFLFQEVYYQQARPSMTGQAAVGRSVFVILLYRHVFSLPIIPCFFLIYLRFPFDKKVFLYFGYISICISLCISISLISISLFPWPVFLLLFENFLCNHSLILRQHFFFLDLSLRQKFLLMHTILHHFQT